MKICRYLPTAHIRTIARFVVFHLYSAGFYVLTSVARLIKES